MWWLTLIFCLISSVLAWVLFIRSYNELRPDVIVLPVPPPHTRTPARQTQQVGNMTLEDGCDLPVPPPYIRAPARQSRQVGTLTLEDRCDLNEVFPLYAAKNPMHRERYFYHTQTGAYNPIRLPVHYKGRNCMKDDIGCETVYDDDVVAVPSLGSSKDFKVSLYENLY